VRAPLPFDPIDRAGDIWEARWPEAGPHVFAAMRAVTSVMRAHQILLSVLDARLRPFGLTFSRYEALVLLSHSRHGALPLSKIGERLQVHATSVTNVIDRLEGAGLVTREPNPRDGRGTLACLTERGAQVTKDATEALNGMLFGLGALGEEELTSLFVVLRALRADAGDFDPAHMNGAQIDGTQIDGAHTEQGAAPPPGRGARWEDEDHATS
jgi:DNA-binding MarR family transcriptional regulator